MIKLFARATFEGYRPAPNEFQVRVPGKVLIEVFRDTGETWKARSVEGNGVFKGIEGPYTYVQARIAERFEKQLSDWAWFDDVGNGAESPAELAITHGIGEKHMQKGLMSGLRRTLCGKIVKNGRIVPRSEAKCDQCKRIDQKEHENVEP
jgi:phage FluMu protein Com